ncbi:hypothetical protein GB937_001545 [Aspergillus fischeri]|nr:hypothetical protein GB937_001545 [Aspergillus fischeri]
MRHQRIWHGDVGATAAAAAAGPAALFPRCQHLRETPPDNLLPPLPWPAIPAAQDLLPAVVWACLRLFLER